MSILNIFGNTGTGKTSLMVHLLNLSNFDIQRFNNCINELQNIVEDFNVDFVKIPKTHCFSNLDISFFKFGFSRQKNNFINPYRIGFKNSYVDVQPLPPYAMVGIDEAQEFFNSRMSIFYPSWQSRFYEKHRHFNLDFILVCQRADLIDINIRTLCSFIEVQSLKIKKDKNDRVKKLVWKVRFIENNKAYERYISSNGKDKSTYVNQKIVANYDVFSLYDSYAEKPRFIETMLDSNVEFKEFQCDIDNRDDLIKYLNDYNSLLPPNFYLKETEKWNKNKNK